MRANYPDRFVADRVARVGKQSECRGRPWCSLRKTTSGSQAGVHTPELDSGFLIGKEPVQCGGTWQDSACSVVYLQAKVIELETTSLEYAAVYAHAGCGAAAAGLHVQKEPAARRGNKPKRNNQ